MFVLKPFQEDAISQLKREFLELWNSDDQNIPLVFKSPTGSGKTIMLAQFLKDIVSDPRFSDVDVAFVWLTFNEESYFQSKNKLFDFYGGAGELNLMDLNDLSREKLRRNDIFFINWQKIKGQSKDSRRLRRENEQGLSFDSFLEETHLSGCKTVAIIDEEHIGSDTALALEVVEGLIKPKITLRVSATPKYIPRRDEVAGYVEVKIDEVVEAGLIKEKIIFQTEEDLKSEQVKDLDQDEILLELAYRKRMEVMKFYQEIGVRINPLVLIQLPNDDAATKETSSISKQSIVIDFLKNKSVYEDEIAIWLSQEKENLEDLEKLDSPVSFLLFKQAAATGWDCPRASILVMFREIKNPTFAIQTVGRILRMPNGERFSNPALNRGYLFTNYARNEVIAQYAKNSSENRPAINGSFRAERISPITLESTFITRADYNDLGDTFQTTFKDVAQKQLKVDQIDLSPSITNGLIVGVEIDDFDNFAKELFEEGGSYEEAISRHDLERLYNLLCFSILAKQTDGNRKFAPERSWGKLKTALNIFFMENLSINRFDAYGIIVKDLINPDSKLRPIIGDALLQYRPIREKEVQKRVQAMKRVGKVVIPPDSLFFSDLFEELEVSRSAMTPFWVEKSYVGRKNEMEFINFLEVSKGVDWWYKNGDHGSEHFAIPYMSSLESKEKLFYPDWIVKTKKTLFIIDTKSGFTADSSETKEKAEALQAWLSEQVGFSGGIAVLDGPNGWKINSGPEYFYSASFEGWSPLTFI